ncbi:amino acid ABC transporter permease [Achromobacter xylosoxidans]|uniref:Octopine transport system permease protein OccM n=2 Tax=Achromobacter TaxID=222 RepID=A0A6J5HKH5_9BURK|nr:MULTISPECIES: amino acid ABC transporter permease [Achromobacter]AHC48715.1 polar amino acid ABC transporter, inner membrane subunit [Achromobacter xylosoxidans NBRC 15126 = ATCC 27061]AMH04522.1 amino acid ABC transporter permease [Achromobacter xylosoxidans]AXA78874.1 amino acid ABC transporter permease [Achromobacter xylosoxidans]EFV84587.1 polar amino acid ABC transporter [Achromobacter xylosoxidans C54]KOQ27264.1 ABC transporter permease [Achromobacter xylosoxidans]
MNYTFDFASVLEQWPLLAQGAWVTVKLSFCATVLGFILGTLCALARNSRLGWLRAVAGGYVELIRNTPLLIQAYFLIFGLSSAGLTMPIMAGAVLALVINIGAYTCEIVRAGIESIPKDQLEAGECLALSRLQVFWHVVLRPAVERVYPSLTSQFVLLMLASSIMSAVGAEELLGVANRIQSDTYRNFEVFIVLWGVYLALSWLMRLGFWLLAQVVFPRRRKLGTPL